MTDTGTAAATAQRSRWRRNPAGTWPGDADIFIYFNNDQGGAAVHDAAAFAAIARRAVTRLAMPGR
ncbi:MAG TPA: hypothetical protein VK162_00110 [Streptosporangiaceae bacterium]|nr:hypothetical protein [Streptosporangiaceae bacterium]